MHIKLRQKSNSKKAAATGDLTGNSIAERIAIVSQNNSKENISYDREIHRERYIFLVQWQKINDDLRLI